MSDVTLGVRGYRPSRMSGYQPERGDCEVVRLANLQRYMLRAQAGLPLFEEPGGLTNPRPPIRPSRAVR